MENFKDLVPVEWGKKRVLTTAQLAYFYGCEPRNISENFKRNESHFKEGKHYFRLEGEDLKQFKNCPVSSGLVGLRTPALYLWTARGAARHAKMLSTEKAWEVFEALEDNYFDRPSFVPESASKPKVRAAYFGKARVYVLLMSDGTVKIGYTRRLCTRFSEIKRKNNLIIKKIYFTPFMSCENARLIERCCKEIFSTQCMKGEFFSVKFEAACAAVDYFAELTAANEIVSKSGAKFFKVASVSADSPEKNPALINSLKLIADKKVD